MSLENGTRLGPYEILSPLGAGGMGEVYRARDSRLGREVAIKVLPADAAADAGRLKRFEKEARSASALNHPNIVTIYDVGSEGETTYIAMELVAGRTLRELLLSGPIPLKRLLQVSAQLAEGLATAHEAGIVHRDLKPENVMVTKDGLVKILDFGLAKLVPSVGSGESSLPTVSRTEPGGLLGTVSYMSPEQAAGQPVDFRSDQFSFGAILYEMVTGKKAFHRGTAVDTLAAILHEEPEPLGKLDPPVLAPLRWNVERCLAKDPADRYAATRDLARDLKAIREHTIESGGFAVALEPRRRAPRLLAAGAVAILTVGALLLSFHAGRKTDPVRAALDAISSYRVTFRRGHVVNARFAPDGETIVYSASWEGNPQEVYVTSIHAAESRPLGIPNAQLLSVSSTGELAVLLKTFDLASHEGDGTLARVSLTGGAPREIMTNVTWMVDWGSAGQIAVRRDGGGKSWIEYPIGKTIYETSSGKINGPRVSPDGEWIAFFDRSRGAADLVVVNRAGQKRVLLRMSDRFSSWGYLAWHPSGREIWFDAIQGEKQPGLFAVTLSGAQRVLMRPAVRVILMDVSRDGRALVEALDSRVELMFGRVGEERERDLSWLGEVRNVDIARDGGSVLFTEVGEGSGPNGTVFLRKTDGSPAIRLADGMAQGLSPDGKSALILVRDPAVKLLRVPTGAGQPEVIPVGSLVVQGAVWLPDGKRLFLLASEPGQATKGFLMELPNGKPGPFGPEGPLWAVFSSDSRFALIGRADGKQLIYSVEGGQPRSVPGLLPEEIGDPYVVAGPFNSDASALYLSHLRESRIDLVDLKTGRRTFWKELVPADRAGVTRIQEYTIGADDRSYAYTVARVISDAIYVIEGLK